MAEESELATLREILTRRRDGAFVSAERMDGRLAEMISEKRRAMAYRLEFSAEAERDL